MEKRWNDIFEGREDNYILPFFWLHGDDREKFASEMEHIRQAGIRSICIESRIHDDFAGEGWWADCDVLMKEAKKRDMTVWILDDKHFPSGCANDKMAQKYPHLRKRQLIETHVDVVGPASGALLVHCADEGEAAKDRRLLAAVVCRRGGPQEVLLGPGEDITHCVKGDLLYWTVPEGCYRIFLLYVSREGVVTGQENYIHLIDPESVDAFIQEVYEPHFERYGGEFGRTFAGFFSDEPCFGNAVMDNAQPSIYEHAIGVPHLALPWREDMSELLRAELQEDMIALLPGLWYPMENGGAKIRLAYMNVLTKLYRDCFCRRLGDWCRAHGVAYIGHVVEDQNCHTRMAYGTGHYFRALEGQDMAGVDVVLHQIVPGMAHYDHNASCYGGQVDTTFFNYMLAKLGSSLSQLQPTMKGRALCEIFGAYGWAEGVPMMKWLMDHMLVRGINHFVPHAFTTRFPWPDCPPHFYARGNNPQYRDFGTLMHYANRMCHLLTGGRPVVSAGILYHAEAEWSGDAYMYSQVPAKALYDEQLDYLIIPWDALQTATVEEGCLCAGNARIPCLIVPYAETLPAALLQTIGDLHEQGLPVIFVDGKPQRDETGAVVSVPGEVVTVDALPGYLRRLVPAGVRLAQPFPLLRVYRYVRDGAEYFMLFNEAMVPFRGEVILPVRDHGIRLDLLYMQSEPIDATDGRVSIELAAYESCVLAFGTGEVLPAAPAKETILRQVGLTAFSISLCEADAYPQFSIYKESSPLFDVTGPDGQPDFSGYIRYETTFEAQAGEGALLKLGRVGETAHVWVNGISCGSRICEPYCLRLDHALQAGTNTLIVEVANSMAYRVRDGFSRHLLLPSSGLLGPVSIEFIGKEPISHD